MKTITRTFAVFITSLIFSLVLFAQPKSVTREAYYSALDEAEAKTEKQIRKKVSIQKLYSGGAVTDTFTGTSEYLAPDKSKWVYVEERSSGVKRIEQIRFGNFVYRKEDKGDWVKKEYYEGPYGLGGGTDDSTREYFIEEAKIGREKFQVLIMKWVNYNNTNISESKIWINKKGLITKMASTTSYLEIKNIVSTIDVTYDYNIKPPKIESPIK